MKKTGKRPEVKFEPREVKRVDGWETSDGKVHDHPVKAAAVQAELDLRRIFEHYVAFDDDEFEGGSHWPRVKTMMLAHRDQIIDLMMAAYMRPSEFDAKLDDIARDRVSPKPDFLSPILESKAKEILRHCFDYAWGATDAFDLPMKSDRELSFDKYWMMRTAKELRYLLPSNAQLFTEFNAKFAFDAGFAACSSNGGGNASTMFKDWWKSSQPKEAPRDAHTSINADDDDAASGLRPAVALSGRFTDYTVTATPCNGVSMPLDHHSIAYSIDAADVPFATIGEAVWKAAQNVQRLDKLSAFDPNFLVLVKFTNRTGVKNML